MSNIVFYFTGTGNGLMIAQAIADELGDCKLVNIAEFTEERISEVERIGFVFPVYFAGLPGIAHEFLRKIKISGEPYLFNVANCGGSNGKIHSQVAKYLKKNGKLLNAGFTLVMPDNYIPIYHVNSDEEVKALCGKARTKISDISETIRGKKPADFETLGSPLFNQFGNLLNKWFVGSLPKRDKYFNVSDACNSCGKCVKACSVNNISMNGKIPVWNGNCEFCLACIHVCPKEAINYKKATLDKGRYQAPKKWL